VVGRSRFVVGGRLAEGRLIFDQPVDEAGHCLCGGPTGLYGGASTGLFSGYSNLGAADEVLVLDESARPRGSYLSAYSRVCFVA
jgi:hypothetical protein